MRVLGRTARARTRLLAVLALGGAAAIALGVHPQTVGAAPLDLAAATLVTTAATPALFDATVLVPGRPVSRCLDVQLPTPPSASAVMVRATGVSGALAPDLTLVIEAGPATGAAAGSCTGFTGNEVFRGTLAELSALSAASPYGAGTGWTLTSSHRTQAFRITAAVRDDSTVQGRTAAADLVWASVAAPDPTPSPTPTPTETPTDAPTAPPTDQPSEPTPSDSPSAEPTARPTSGPTGGPTSDPTNEPGDGGASSAAPVPGDGDSGGGSHGSGLLRSLLPVSRQVGQTVIGTAEQSHFPVALLGMVGLFLALQSSLDRRDPKLALAPLDDDDDLPFDTGLLR